MGFSRTGLIFDILGRIAEAALWSQRPGSFGYGTTWARAGVNMERARLAPPNNASETRDEARMACAFGIEAVLMCLRPKIALLVAEHFVGCLLTRRTWPRM